MAVTDILGFIAAIGIGFSLGFIGGGGSILTVPLLVYLFKVAPVEATAYSLFIVGCTSLVGAIRKWQHREICLKTALIFGVPSMVAVYLMRQFFVPMIPEILGHFGEFVLTKNRLLLLLFAVLMIVAALTMIREKQRSQRLANGHEQSRNVGLVPVQGIAEGTVTGLVGAGGGFLIIPSLVLFARLPMKVAIGTSLLIIAVKSLVGFCGDLAHYHMNWALLVPTTLLAVAGIFLGDKLSARVPAAQLKKLFGWFVLSVGVFILVWELSVLL